MGFLFWPMNYLEELLFAHTQCCFVILWSLSSFCAPWSESMVDIISTKITKTLCYLLKYLWLLHCGFFFSVLSLLKRNVILLIVERSVLFTSFRSNLLIALRTYFVSLLISYLLYLSVTDRAVLQSPAVKCGFASRDFVSTFFKVVMLGAYVNMLYLHFKRFLLSLCSDSL